MWYNVKALAIGKPHKCQVTGNTLSQKPRKESVVRVSKGKQAKRKNRIEKQKLNTKKCTNWKSKDCFAGSRT